MALNIIRLGQTFEASTSFVNSDGTPFVPISPATYEIKDFNNNHILAGIGAQDTTYPDKWSASITIPTTAPFAANDKYSITWSITGQGTSATNAEYFNVQPQTDIDINELDNVALEGSDIVDSLNISLIDTITTLDVRIVRDDGTALWSLPTQLDPPSVIANNTKIYTINASGVSLITQNKPYAIEWKYIVNGSTRRELHFLYVVSMKLLIFMEQLRQFIDKARFSHPNPDLRFNEVDLASYIMQGLSIVNGYKPVVTSYTINDIPTWLEYYLILAGAYVALSAQYLAEGMAAFDFSGQSVSLTVDRTQYIDAALSRILDLLQNQLPTIKKIDALNGSGGGNAAGVLGISPGPTLNSRFGSSLTFDGSLLKPYSNRLTYYENFAGIL